MSISLKLKCFKSEQADDNREAKEFCMESPFQRTKREVQLQLAESQKYRASILKNVATFAGLSPEAIVTAAQSMEEVFFRKGDIIIEQDDIGESFFVLEEGLVSVTRKANIRDYNETAKELVQLGQNSHFGEISLLTAETRSATVTVISDKAKCLIMTKTKFDELLATTNKIIAENRRIIGKDVLDTVPLFKTLTAVNKKKILDAMVPMSYSSQSYICRQGTTGHTFFILTEGTCKVTINNENRTETEVARLRPGDFFGEVALIESSNRRTANVISLDAVNCLTLSRSDFNRLLKALKVKIQEHQVMRHNANQSNLANGQSNDTDGQLGRRFNNLAKKRRISGYNTHGQRDDIRISTMLKRFAKFTTESLWNSLYSRMYREMLLDPTKAVEYGKLATIIMRSNDTRTTALQSIALQSTRILEMDCPRRSVADNTFVMGLLRQRNVLKDKLCRNWPTHQYSVLCRKAKLVRVKAFRKIIEADSRGTTAFLILRGCVRIFSKVGNSNVGGAVKLYFEEDLFPGEVFGETALSGMHTRLITAQAVTNVDLAVIDDSDFVLAQDRDSMHMGTEERVAFLKQIPMFKLWDNYKLMRLAVALVQEEINKNVVIVQKGVVCKDLHFLVNGRIDIIDHIEKKNIVTTLLKFDYLGESGLINKFVKASSSKVIEDHFAIAVTRVDVLILHESNYFIFDMSNLEIIRNTFSAKTSWRKDRLIKMKFERAKVRSYKKGLSKEYDSTSTNEPSNNLTDTYANSESVNLKKNVAKLPLMESNNLESRQSCVSNVEIGDTLFSRKEGFGNKIESSKKVLKLNDMEDIPQIFTEGFDPFMITTSIKNKALLEKAQDAMILGRRPKSARLLIASADSRRHTGFSGGKPRPCSASDSLRLNTIKYGDHFVESTKNEDASKVSDLNRTYLRGSYRIPSPVIL